MPLKVVEMSETDFAEMIQAEYAAYQGSLVERLLFPNGRSPEVLDMQEKHAIAEAQEDRTVRNIKVVDTDGNNKLIAYARWRLLFGESTQSPHSRAGQQLVYPGADPAGSDIWRTVVQARRKQHIGNTPHVYLSSLFTTPEGRGRGAATMLIQWGCQIADHHRVPTYLQSLLPVGNQLYSKCGFKEVYTIDVDLASIGDEGSQPTWLMVRYPQAISTAQE